MTAHAAALIKKILAQIECIRALGYAIVCMAHLASRFGVLFMKQRVQPEWILAMRFHDAGRGAAITAVTSRTAELLRIVNLQEFFARVTDKSVRQIVQLLLARAGGRHIGRVYCERLARPQMTNLATVYDRKLVDVDLMAENCVVERVLVLPNQIVNVLLRQQADMVLQIFIASLRELGWLFEQLRFFTEDFRLLIAEIVESLFQLVILHFSPRKLSAVVRHFEVDGFV